MSNKKFIENLWKNIENNQIDNLKNFYLDNASIYFPESGEIFFNLNSFIKYNKKYPKDFSFNIEKTYKNNDITISIIKIIKDDVSFYFVSFYKFIKNKIHKSIEFWSQEIDKNFINNKLTRITNDRIFDF